MSEDTEKQFDIFISYRRDGGEIMARLLYFMLTRRGYTVFYDREAMESGLFDKNIERAIDSCTDFLLILSHRMFEGRKPDEDNVLAELKYAKENGKNILPLVMPGFDYSEMMDYEMPEELSDFQKIHAAEVVIASFDDDFIQKHIKLRSKPSNHSGVLTEALEFGNEKDNAYSKVPDELKQETLKNILVSYMEEENAEMILDMIRPYLERKFNEKKDFRYTLSITSLKEGSCPFCKLPFENLREKYCRVYERLSFSKRYIKSEGPDEIWIAFTFDDGSLDDNLHDEKVFFSESLKLRREDIDVIKAMTKDMYTEMVERLFKLQVAINGRSPEHEIAVEETGIYVKYKLPERSKEIRFKASFEIPFDYNNNFLYISISEPTFSPEILIEYQEDYFDATLIPFFDDTMKLTESTGFNGEFEMCAEDRWIMPMSGAIINIREDAEG